jgi:hypothetical protein
MMDEWALASQARSRFLATLGMTARKARATAETNAGSFPFGKLRVRMTAKNKQRQEQQPMRGSFGYASG